MKKYLLIIIVIIPLFSCQSRVDNKEVHLYMASSLFHLKPYFQNIADSLNLKLMINHSSSGVLARQIGEGAEADIFISANKEWVDYLINKNIYTENAVQILAGNSLVVIKHQNSDFVVPRLVNDATYDLSEYGRFSMGSPEHVPAGTYSKEFLQNIGLYEYIKGKVILTKDVVSTLKYVEMNECDWGIVFSSLVKQSGSCKVVQMIPDSLHSPIQYHIAIQENADSSVIKLYSAITSSSFRYKLRELGFK